MTLKELTQEIQYVENDVERRLWFAINEGKVDPIEKLLIEYNINLDWINVNFVFETKFQPFPFLISSPFFPLFSP